MADKQSLLEINSLKERAIETLKFMNVELQRLTLKNDIQSKVHNDLNQQQREYFLQQQIKTIQEELGGTSYEEELEEMQERSLLKLWDEDVKKHFDKELSKLQRMNPQVAEYSIQRNYLDLFLDLPWNEFSKDQFDLKEQNVFRQGSLRFRRCKKTHHRILGSFKTSQRHEIPNFMFVWPSRSW